MTPRRKSRPPGGRRSGAPPGFRPLKRLSQNFLVDTEIARKIVDLSRIEPTDTVIEVGPGTGALTGHLLERAKRVHAVELDRKLFARLGVEYDSEPRLVLHEDDILKVRIRDLVPEGQVVVVGNLPYAITSELVLWLLDQHRDVRRAVVLMQREVARRLTAEPGTRAAGSLTLRLRYRAEAESILDVPPGAFRPVPKVHSSLVAFRFLEEPVVHPQDEALFFRVIRASFGKRRKTLANALSSGLTLPRETVEEVAREAGIDPRERGERLTLEEFRDLADHLRERLDARTTDS
jgi:16S rRNA (adenine1518-N6/adenine1519-N6)-dimethyltransferase